MGASRAPAAAETGALIVTRADPAAAPRLYARCGADLPELRSAVALADALAARDARAFEARQGGEPHGFLTAARVADELHIHAVAVARDRRRQGVASALLRTALAAAHEEGLARALLELRAGNGAARALYARHGFREVGQRPCYYRDGEDALLLTRADLASEEGS